VNFHQDDFTQFRKILFSKVVKIKKNIYKLQHKTPVIYKYKKDTQIILYESFCQNLRSPFLIFNYFRVRAQNGIRKLKISLWLNDMALYGFYQLQRITIMHRLNITVCLNLALFEPVCQE